MDRLRTGWFRYVGARGAKCLPRNKFTIAPSFTGNHEEDQQKTFLRPLGLRRGWHGRHAPGAQTTLAERFVAEQFVRSSTHRELVAIRHASPIHVKSPHEVAGDRYWPDNNGQMSYSLRNCGSRPAKSGHLKLPISWPEAGRARGSTSLAHLQQAIHQLLKWASAAGNELALLRQWRVLNPRLLSIGLPEC